eukprot:2374426-Rhodomonas_salina.1
MACSASATALLTPHARGRAKQKHHRAPKKKKKKRRGKKKEKKAVAAAVRGHTWAPALGLGWACFSERWTGIGHGVVRRLGCTTCGRHIPPVSTAHRKARTVCLYWALCSVGTCTVCRYCASSSMRVGTYALSVLSIA